MSNADVDLEEEGEGGLSVGVPVWKHRWSMHVTMLSSINDRQHSLDDMRLMLRTNILRDMTVNVLLDVSLGKKKKINIISY